MTCTNPRCVRIREALDAVDWRGLSELIFRIENTASQRWIPDDIVDVIEPLASVKWLASVLEMDECLEIGGRARAAARSTDNSQLSTGVGP